MTEAVDAPLPPGELHDYLLVLGGALLKYGCPTHRAETVIREVAALEGYQADAFGTPTGLFVTLVHPDSGPQLRMARVKAWGTDLGRLAQLDRIFNDVLANKATLAEANRKLIEVETGGARYPGWAIWAASAGASGAAAVFFRGGWGEVAFGAIGGLVVAVLGSLLGRDARTRLLGEFLGGLAAGLVAWAASYFLPQTLREVVVLSTIITLVPGLSMTSALSEIAHKNLVSGGARLMDAMMILLSMVFGIAVAVTAEQLTGWVQALPPGPLPTPDVSLPVEIGALLVAAFSFSIAFSVPRGLVHLSMLAAALSWLATVAGQRWLPGALSAFAASSAVALLSNLLARLTQRPAQLFLVPGLILLVPGSFGFRSLEMFLRGEFLGGAARGFDMFLTAGAIVVGMLVANVILPARKML